MTAIVELNGAYYNTKGTARQSYVDRLSPPFRTTGVQVRSDDASINRFVHNSFPLGIGFPEMHRETGWGVGGLLDSTCWTANNFVTLGKLHEAQTHAVPRDFCSKMALFKGDLYGLFWQDGGDSEPSTVSSTFSGSTDTWGNVGQINNPSGGSNFIGKGFDLVPHKDSLFALCNGGADVTPATAENEAFGMRVTTDGTTWTDAGGTGFPDSNTTNEYILQANINDGAIVDLGRLLSFGNTLIAAVLRDSDAPDGDDLIEVLSTTDGGTNWVSDVTIPSGDGPKALVDWRDLAGARSPVIVTAEGVFSIDIANNTFTMIYELDGDPNNGKWAVVGNDAALWLGLGSGDVLRLAINDQGHLDVITVGPPGDGFITARQGHATFLLRTPSEWLFVAYGGHASGQQASVWMINTQSPQRDPETGKIFYPWHSFYYHGTENIEIRMLAYSTESDATARIHMALVTDINDSDTMQHIEEPLTSPVQSTTIKYQATSILRLPSDDMGDPQTVAMVLTGLATADALTAGSGGSGGSGDEFITHRYGVDGASDTTASLGDYLSGQLSLSFPAGSGVEGVAARRIGTNLLFDRSTTNTNRPILLDFEIQSISILLDKLAWDFEIDIEATARDNPPTPVPNQTAAETIIAAIETVAALTTLATFTIGEMTQTRVRIPNSQPPIFQLETVNSRGQVLGDRTGTITMRVEEGR